MTGDEIPQIDNLIDLMGRLVEPPVPDPVSLAPQTAGWWVLGAMLAAALAAALWRAHRRWKANAYRRAALTELAATDDPAQIAAILRRTALAAYPRARVAGKAGADWLAFLDTTGGFPADAGAVLNRAPYAATTGHDSALKPAAERWIRHHGPAA